MMIDIKDVLTLSDNNEYVVVSKIDYENKTYYYLVDNNNHNNLKFCYLDNDELVEIENKGLTTKLLPIFLEAAKKEIEESQY